MLRYVERAPIPDIKCIVKTRRTREKEYSVEDIHKEHTLAVCKQQRHNLASSATSDLTTVNLRDFTSSTK